jgi:hypothetical protein
MHQGNHQVSDDLQVREYRGVASIPPERLRPNRRLAIMPTINSLMHRKNTMTAVVGEGSARVPACITDNNAFLPARQRKD